MRTRILYIAVPLFTFLAVYRFWNSGPMAASTSMDQGVRTSAYAYPAAITSADHFNSEKNAEVTQRWGKAIRNGQ